MTRQLLTLLVVSGILLTISCKDEETTSSSDHPLKGKWYIQNIAYSGCTSSEDNFDCTSADCLKIEIDANGYYTFTSLVNGASTVDHGSCRIMGSDVEICKNEGTNCTTYELVHEQGAFYFATVDHDPVTNCITTTTYVKL